MIAKAMRGRAFSGLARYLEAGRDGNAPERVEWMEARNLPTTDPETASLLMRATAAQSDRVQRPVYHLALSFDPEDQVDRATMVRVADRLLADLGIQDHQVLIVAHGDTAHRHLHLMINRVHPETFRAWDPRSDYQQIERSLRVQERELGLREVAGHHARLEGQREPGRAESLRPGEIRKWERTGEAPLAERVREAVGKDFREARSWADLEARLAQRGLRLEGRGRGFVVTDGVEAVKASRLATGTSRRALEERFGPMDTAQREGRDPSTPATEAKESPAAKEEASRHTSTPEREAAREAAQSAPKVEGQDLGRRSREKQEPAVAGEGPKADGNGRASKEAEQGRGAGAADASATKPERERRAKDGPVLDARLGGLRKSIDQLERRLELEGRRDGAGEALGRARSHLEPLRGQRAEAREASRHLNAALKEVYRDPRAARRELHVRAKEEGIGGATMEMARHPGRFGELRGTGVGPLRSAERKAALRAAPRLEAAGTAHLRATRAAWDGRQEYRGARSNVQQLERKVRDLDAVLARSPGSAELRLRLTRDLHRLQPNQRQALQRSLPITKGQVLAAALVATHAFAREQGHER